MLSSLPGGLHTLHTVKTVCRAGGHRKQPLCIQCGEDQERSSREDHQMEAPVNMKNLQEVFLEGALQSACCESDFRTGSSGWSQQDPV